MPLIKARPPLSGPAESIRRPQERACHQSVSPCPLNDWERRCRPITWPRESAARLLPSRGGNSYPHRICPFLSRHFRARRQSRHCARGVVLMEVCEHVRPISPKETRYPCRIAIDECLYFSPLSPACPWQAGRLPASFTPRMPRPRRPPHRRLTQRNQRAGRKHQETTPGP